MESDPVMLTSGSTNDAGSTIGGAVVNDDPQRRLNCLDYHGIDRALEVYFLITDRGYDQESRVGCRVDHDVFSRRLVVSSVAWNWPAPSSNPTS